MSRSFYFENPAFYNNLAKVKFDDSRLFFLKNVFVKNCFCFANTFLHELII